MSESRSRIAIDARMSEHTGIGRYVRNLVNALLRRSDSLSYVLITNPKEDPTAVWDWLEAPPSQRHRIEVVSFARPLPIYSLAEQAWLPKVIKDKQVGLFHAPHFNIPLWSSVPLVVTLHDVIYLSHPESAPSCLGGRYARFMLGRAAQRARRVITGTRASAAELCAELALAEQKVTVIGHGAEEMGQWVAQLRRGGCEVISPRVRELPRFILSVGHHLPHKNQVVLVAALARLRELGFPELVLALAGPRGRGTRAIEDAARRHGVAERVIVLGRVHDRDLAYLYEHAACLVQPSRAEGFGLPLLEAMISGCPVVASGWPAHRELAGDAALSCNPENADAFAAAIGRLLLQPNQAESLARKGVQRAKQFSFDITAEQTAAVYEELLPAERRQH